MVMKDRRGNEICDGDLVYWDQSWGSISNPRIPRGTETKSSVWIEGRIIRNKDGRFKMEVTDSSARAQHYFHNCVPGRIYGVAIAYANRCNWLKADDDWWSIWGVQ